MPLCITRKPGQRILIDHDIEIRLVQVKGKEVRLSISGEGHTIRRPGNDQDKKDHETWERAKRLHEEKVQ